MGPTAEDVLARLSELRRGDESVNDRFIGWLIADDPARAARVLDKMVAFRWPAETQGSE